jgi:uncharacterized protein
MRHYITLLIKHRFPVLALILIITTIWGVIALQGTLASSVESIFFGKEHAGFQAYKQRIREFANDEVFIAIYKDEDLLSEESLAQLENVVGKIERIPEVGRIDSLLTAQHVFSDAETLYVEKYVDEAYDTPEDRRMLLTRIKTDPVLNGLLVSDDGQHAAVLVELIPDEERPVERGPLIFKEVKTLFLQSGFAENDLHFVGMTTTFAEIMAQSYFNLSRLFPIVCVVLLLMVLVLFHNLWPVAITLGVSLISVIWTYGFAVLLDKNISIFVTMSPAIIIIVATSDVIHLCNAYLLEIGSGKSKEDAILQSGTEVGAACFWTSATTFVGFVSIVFVPVPGFRIMGIVLGFGVAVALLLAMTLTPILFSLLKPPTIRTYEESWSQKLLGRFLFKIEEYILKIPWKVVVLFAIIFVAAIMGTSRMVIETDFNKRLAEDNWVRVDEAYYNEHFAGANFLEIFVETPRENGIFDIETFKSIQMFQQKMETLPEVDKVSSLVNVIETIDHELNPQGEVPLSDDLLAQYVLLFEMSGGEDLDRIVDFERRTVRLAVRLPENGFMFSYEAGEKVRELGERLLNRKADVQVSGMTYLLGGFLDDILHGQITGLIFAFFTIFVMMALMFRSLTIGLWSMLPNVLPLLALGGYVGFFWDATDTDTIIVAMIAIGIGVDDTIHFLTRLKFESARTADPINALQRAFHFCGRAMMSTTLILALGFSPFAISDYFTVHMFGTLLPYTLIVAVLADILLVPALVKMGFVRFPFTNDN